MDPFEFCFAFHFEPTMASFDFFVSFVPNQQIDIFGVY
jgi:hypothetical protein